MWSQATIFAFSVVFLVLAVKVKVVMKIRIPFRQWLSMVIASVVGTATSLFVRFSVYSGSGISTKYGWPHAYYERWISFRPLENSPSIWPGIGSAAENRVGFWLGPIGSYAWINVLFYFSLISLGLVLVSAVRLARKMGKKV